MSRLPMRPFGRLKRTQIPHCPWSLWDRAPACRCRLWFAIARRNERKEAWRGSWERDDDHM